MFSTGSERIVVIEDLRKPGIFFPASWDLHRSHQQQSEPVKIERFRISLLHAFISHYPAALTSLGS